MKIVGLYVGVILGVLFFIMSIAVAFGIYKRRAKEDKRGKSRHTMDEGSVSSTMFVQHKRENSAGFDAKITLKT